VSNVGPTQFDVRWMALAVDLARQCPPSEGAFSVGVVIVDEDGNELARGYSRETDAHVHAEESALAKLPPNDRRLSCATIYSTLEPCSQRKSRPRSCTQLILAAGIPRVVIAWREPSLFVADAQGTELLTAEGVTVVEMPEFAEQAKEPNRHLSRSTHSSLQSNRTGFVPTASFAAGTHGAVDSGPSAPPGREFEVELRGCGGAVGKPNHLHGRHIPRIRTDAEPRSGPEARQL